MLRICTAIKGATEGVGDLLHEPDEVSSVHFIRDEDTYLGGLRKVPG